MFTARPWDVATTFPSARRACAVAPHALTTCPFAAAIQTLPSNLHVRVAFRTVYEERFGYKIPGQGVSPGFSQAVFGDLLKPIVNKLVLPPRGSSPVEQLGMLDLKGPRFPCVAPLDRHGHPQGQKCTQHRNLM